MIIDKSETCILNIIYAVESAFLFFMRNTSCGIPLDTLCVTLLQEVHLQSSLEYHLDIKITMPEVQDLLTSLLTSDSKKNFYNMKIKTMVQL